ncbi:hypothetical protein BJ138DRAFT_1160509 [Hygrophoropsis aurantiaca]|uniref:Uncharacterized protein n=1 Tax=Hygrophoropsis aurantiaca TaxID=72124 RepID=A0ACB8A2U9_9AGAM|nr:hypothetical protein BJ138DRAFT_1160509 [Hygrophoropsis aurantiaca]
MLHSNALLPILSISLSFVYGLPAASTNVTIVCPGYQWAVIIEELKPPPYAVYNQYIYLTDCRGVASVRSSDLPNAPLQISAYDEVYVLVFSSLLARMRFNGMSRYECVVPDIEYFCGSSSVDTCVSSNKFSACRQSLTRIQCGQAS